MSSHFRGNGLARETERAARSQPTALEELNHIETTVNPDTGLKPASFQTEARFILAPVAKVRADFRYSISTQLIFC